MKSKKRIGVYCTTQNDQEGMEILDYLDKTKTDILQELGDSIEWRIEDTPTASVYQACDDIFSDEYREDIKEFFKDWLNRFVNVYRPRLKKYELENKNY